MAAYYPHSSTPDNLELSAQYSDKQATVYLQEPRRLSNNPAPDADGSSMEQMEKEVDELLREADSLAEDLGNEIGQDNSEPSERDAEFFESKTDSEACLDVQIAHADAALNDATREIGSEKPAKEQQEEPSTSDQKDSDSVPSDQAEQQVAQSGESPAPPPDVKKAEDSGSSDGQKPAPTSAKTPLKLPPKNVLKLPPKKKPGGAGKPDGAQSGPGGKPGATPNTDLSELIAADVDQPAFDLKEPSKKGKLHKLLKITRLSSPKWSYYGERLCNLLDLVDRPLQRISYKIRSLIGWVAIAILIAATFLLWFAIL